MRIAGLLDRFGLSFEFRVEIRDLLVHCFNRVLRARDIARFVNNLLAATGFSAWMEGEALEIQNILHTPQGKPRVAIFSIAHLGEAERMLRNFRRQNRTRPTLSRKGATMEDFEKAHLITDLGGKSN